MRINLLSNGERNPGRNIVCLTLTFFGSTHVCPSTNIEKNSISPGKLALVSINSRNNAIGPTGAQACPNPTADFIQCRRPRLPFRNKPIWALFQDTCHGEPALERSINTAFAPCFIGNSVIGVDHIHSGSGCIAAAVGISTGDGTANDRGWGIRWQWNCRPDVPAETASVQVNTAAAAEPAAAEA